MAKLTNIVVTSIVTLRLGLRVEELLPGRYLVWCMPPGRIVSDGDGLEHDLAVEDNDPERARSRAIANALERLALEIRRGTRGPSHAVYGISKYEDEAPSRPRRAGA